MRSTGQPARVGLVVRWPTGGIRTHLKYLYANLPAGKYQPVLIAPEGPETDFLFENLSAWNPEARLAKKLGRLVFGQVVLRTLLSERLDVVHSQGFTSAAFVGIPARLLGIPHIATIHEVITEANAVRLGRLGCKTLGLALEQATVVHAVGRGLAANLADKLLSARYARHRLRVIGNGVDLPQFSNVVPRSIRSELAIAEDLFIIGFLGRFMAPKGFRTLIEAASIMRSDGSPRPFRILAVGDGGFVREDRAEICRRGLESHFIFQPPVENPAPTLAALDCLAMPSRWEGFGLLAAEALCLGVPLIASDCTGLSEVVVNSPARVFSEGNARELANAIRDEMLSPSGARARDFIPEARRRFDVRCAARQIDLLFDEVLSLNN